MAIRELRSARATVCPYRRLSSFREEDAPFFFGRDEVCETLAASIQRSGFVAVVGPSGSGKSSVVRAGLIPLLRQERAGGSGKWPSWFRVPGPSTRYRTR